MKAGDLVVDQGAEGMLLYKLLYKLPYKHARAPML